MSETHAEFAALFERMSDPAVIIDEAGERLVASNEAFAAFVKRSRESLAGRFIEEFWQFDSRGEEERQSEREASVLTADERGWVRIRAERLACRWEGRAATLCLVRGASGNEKIYLDRLGRDEKGTLFDYLQEATEQVEVVNRVVAAVNSSHTIDEIFNLASEQMRTLLPFDRASIALCEDDGQHLRVFALSGENIGSLMVGSVAAMRGSVTELALRERQMVVIPDLRAEKRFNIYADLRHENFRSAVCVPLFSTRRAVGSLNLTSRTLNAYNRKHRVALERLAAPLAIAIEKALLVQQAVQRSQEMEAAARREKLCAHIGRQLAESLDPTSVLQETVEALGRMLGVDRCHIALFGRGGADGNGGDGGALVDYEYLADPGIESLRGRVGSLHGSRYAQRILAADTPVAIEDWNALEPDDLIELYKRLNVRAVLVAPVHAGSARQGVLELHDCRGARAWTEEDCRLLGTIAAQVSVALTNAQLYEASRLRNKELRGLFEISRTFSTLADISEISGRLARAIAQLVGATMCLIATYDRRHNTVRGEAPGYNTSPQMVNEFCFELDPENKKGTPFPAGEPFFSNDPAHDPQIDRDFVERYQITSVLSVPMRIKRELIGFIYVANRAGGFRDRDLRLLEIFAAQAAETIINARLFATIQSQAEREAIVNRLLLSLQRGGDPKEKIQAVIERVGEVLDLDRCSAVLFTENGDNAFFGEWCADGVAPIAHWQDILERSPIRYALEIHRRPLMAEDVRAHPLAVGFEDLIEKTSVRSLLAVPIMHQGRVIGSISAHQTRRKRRWAEDDVDLLAAVATHVGSTLENARLIADLREANRLKDEFLATLSHELRTPLTAITGWVDLLSENALLETNEELAEGIAAISASATSLAQLISDLLDLSRIQRSMLRLEREAFDINVTVMNAVRMVRQAALARRHELKLELDENLPLIVFDQMRIQQVLWNLLMNAIKFTPPGGLISVRTRYAEETTPESDEDAYDRRHRRWLVVEVADTGEGIPPDFLPYIWDRFRQADSSVTRRHGGLGIGLALVKELIEAHDGQVQAVSEGHGATFTLRLPVLDGKEWSEREMSRSLPPRARG